MSEEQEKYLTRTPDSVIRGDAGSPDGCSEGTAARPHGCQQTSLGGQKMRSSMATYYFDTDEALAYGIDGAIMLYNLRFWILKNKANKKHFHDGRYWTYNSATAFAELFPFWSTSKIGRVLRLLEEKGAIMSGNYNKVGYDKTKWYTVLIDEPNSEMKDGCSEMENGSYKNEQPIPDSNPHEKHHISCGEADASAESGSEKDSTPKPSSPKKKKRMTPPTREEVVAWAGEWAKDHGKPVEATKAIAEQARQHYDRVDWIDSEDKKVGSWKRKIAGVWLDERHYAEFARGGKPQWKVEQEAEQKKIREGIIYC